MKNLFASSFIAIALVVSSCGSSTEEKPTTDSTAADSTTVKVDSTAKDSTVVVDTTKKADKK